MHSNLCDILKDKTKVKVIGETVEHNLNIGDIGEVLATTKTCYLVRSNEHQDLVLKTDCEIIKGE